MTAAASPFPNYGAELSAAWQTHLAPREPDAPTVVSLFAGAGGSSLGYSMAGYRELLAVEWDDHAAACLARNFSGVRIHHGDIANVKPGMLDLRPGQLDVLDGSPPCQGFSTNGARQLDDPRNQLFRQFVRLLRAWQPRAFVMENVAGMADGKMRAIFAEIRAELRSSGYDVSSRELPASYYRVPQRRKRIIIIGVRTDLAIQASHPVPQSREVTVGEALTGLEDDIGQRREPPATTARLLPYLRPGERGADVLGRYGKAGGFFNKVRLRADRPAPTILQDRSAVLIHPRYNRLLGSRELTRLGSFPDEYDWGTSTCSKIQQRVGNSVPPLFMRAIATHVRHLLDSAKTMAS